MVRSPNELNIDNILTNHEIKKELIKIIKNQIGSENVELTVEPANKKGESFMGETFRIQYRKSGANVETNSLILKVPSNDRIPVNESRIRQMFMREIFMYNTVFPLYHEFQLSKGIDPCEYGFNAIPRCYGCISDQFSEAIFLEDLKLRQFEMIDIRQEALTFQHVSLAMQALGKLHALSFALKDQQPEKFDQLKNQLTEQFWIHQENNQHFYGGISRFRACLEENGRFDLSEKLEKVFGEYSVTRIMELVSGAAAEPYAVINHGDVTSFNSMFRKDKCGKAIAIGLLDYQFSRYASPVIELVLLLLCCTTHELRDKHYDEFLQIYHKSLSNFLIKLGTDPMKLFPYEALLDQCQKFGVYTLFVGIMFWMVIFANPDTVPDSKVSFRDREQGSVFLVSDTFKKEYNKKVEQLVDDLVKYDYI